MKVRCKEKKNNTPNRKQVQTNNKKEKNLKRQGFRGKKALLAFTNLNCLRLVHKIFGLIYHCNACVTFFLFPAHRSREGAFWRW